MFLKEASPTYAKMFALDCYELCLERHIENIVKQMWPLIQKKTKELCHGCQTDHPLQKQHDVCLMMDDDERFSKTFSSAWSLINLKPLLEDVKLFVRARRELSERIRRDIDIQKGRS